MKFQNNILMADDDKNICELIRLYLEKEGYGVCCVYDGKAAVDAVATGDFSLVILDIMMPVLDGMEALKEIRRNSKIPIIMLTAKGETIDKVLGLELGADDYIVKPFEPKELIARIKAILRRVSDESGGEPDGLNFENLYINKSTYEMKVNGEEVDTPPKELELLFYLCSHPNKVYTRDQLLNEVWGYDYYGDSRTVDVHVKRLREKIDGVSERWSLKTVWGVGYKFEVR
ncbi:MAG: response regulator transcription factor [Ruminococcaceae bacterium]|nr:response regulator transcription factor [Oscillospiraceae bacterium]